MEMRVQDSNPSNSDDSDDFLTKTLIAGLLLSFLGAVSSIASLAYQLFFWFKNGNWIPLPLSYFLKKLNLDLTSIYSPNDWVGFAKSIQWLIELHAGLVFLIIGIFLFAISFILMSILG